MKTKLFALLLTGALLCTTLGVRAAPSGPSAKAAARLKKNPPTAWLAHYLPDDRYKIAGNVWKYVSTNLDTYYHVPSSPNMMRQPNSGVIGFPSAQAAEEAGYKPDPSDGTLNQVQRVAEANAMAREEDAVSSGDRTFVKRSGKVILGDGASTLVVPAGWQRLISQRDSKNGSNFSIDLMAHGGSGNMALLLTMTFPNVNVERQLSSGTVAANLKRFGTMANSTGEINNSGAGKVGDWLQQAKVRRTNWGGLSGIAISPPPGVGAGAGNMIMVGRGSKAYMFQIVGKGKSPASTSQMVKSFVPR